MNNKLKIEDLRVGDRVEVLVVGAHVWGGVVEVRTSPRGGVLVDVAISTGGRGYNYDQASIDGGILRLAKPVQTLAEQVAALEQELKDALGKLKVANYLRIKALDALKVALKVTP